MNPDWSNAPEWANYFAMDADGTWWWHELKPTIENKSQSEWYSEGKMMYAFGLNLDWQNSMKARNCEKHNHRD